LHTSKSGTNPSQPRVIIIVVVVVVIVVVVVVVVVAVLTYPPPPGIKSYTQPCPSGESRVSDEMVLQILSRKT